jgi:hypothetical protein
MYFEVKFIRHPRNIFRRLAGEFWRRLLVGNAGGD